MRYFLLLLLFLAALPVAAQDTTTSLSELTVELWPDYDRPAMLVLITGTVPDAATLPATVVLPLPADAELFAIARFEETGALISDVESSEAGGLLTLITPGRRFRVEYYQPYEVDGDDHSFRFEWLSDLTIDSMSAVVQQPLAATQITIDPQPSGSAPSRGDGLNYFQLSPRPVAAGEPFTVEVTYTVEAPLLSAPVATVPATTVAPAETSTTGGPNLLWLLLAIPVGVALIAGAWFLGRQQGSGGRSRKPRPSRPGQTATKSTGNGPAKFCHNCGQQAQAGDVFCRKCGTRLRQ